MQLEGWRKHRFLVVMEWNGNLFRKCTSCCFILLSACFCKFPWAILYVCISLTACASADDLSISGILSISPLSQIWSACNLGSRPNIELIWRVTGGHVRRTVIHHFQLQQMLRPLHLLLIIQRLQQVVHCSIESCAKRFLLDYKLLFATCLRHRSCTIVRSQKQIFRVEHSLADIVFFLNGP